jgi:PKD repeat protein
VRLTVTGAGGLTAGAARSITVAPRPPQASFSSSPLRPVPGRTVGFTAATAVVPGGAPLVSYAWDFGDGESGTGATTGHVYQSSGSYHVTLTVTDAAGQTANATASVGVVAADRPSASFVYEPIPIAAGADETFASVAIRRMGRFAVTKIVDWKWTFGDLSPIVHGSHVHHTFAAVGRYRVRLTVRDAGGRTGTVASTLVVLPRDSVVAVVETISIGDVPVLVPPAVLGITEPIGTSDAPALTPPDRITVVETIGATDGTAPVHH